MTQLVAEKGLDFAPVCDGGAREDQLCFEEDARGLAYRCMLDKGYAVVRFVVDDEGAHFAFNHRSGNYVCMIPAEQLILIPDDNFERRHRMSFEGFDDHCRKNGACSSRADRVKDMVEKFSGKRMDLYDLLTNSSYTQ